MKYRPQFPKRFGGIQHARSFFRELFPWYNTEHYHTGLGLFTPAMVHHGLADAIVAQRQQVLDSAYAAHPERFVHHQPTAIQPPRQVWINPPLREGREEVLQ